LVDELEVDLHRRAPKGQPSLNHRRVVILDCAVHRVISAESTGLPGTNDAANAIHNANS
jgi:hypothetical protein